MPYKEQPVTPGPSSAEYLREYKILVTFDDDEVGVVDLQRELWGEVFEPLLDVGRFRRFRFDPELDTVVWPTGADLSPEYLHERAVASESAEPRAAGRMVAPGALPARSGRKVPQGPRRQRVRAGQRRIGVRRRHEGTPESPARVDALQCRCGRWVDRVLERYGPALASRPVVDFRPGSMNAAGRLTDWQRNGT